jgi:hypothetical protein
VLEHPGTRPTEKERYCGRENSSATRATPPTDQEHEGGEDRNCFYCLEGWVFLGSIGHDGEEVYEAIHCRRCRGTGRLNR